MHRARHIQISTPAGVARGHQLCSAGEEHARDRLRCCRRGRAVVRPSPAAAPRPSARLHRRRRRCRPRRPSARPRALPVRRPTRPSRSSRTTTRAPWPRPARATSRSSSTPGPPWCHTCLSMRATCSRTPRSQRFVVALRLAVARHRARRQRRHRQRGSRVTVLPTLYVIDPATEQPVLAWPGSLTAPELADLLDDAASARARAETPEARRPRPCCADTRPAPRASSTRPSRLPCGARGGAARLAATAAGRRRAGHPPGRRQAARRLRHPRRRRGPAACRPARRSPTCCASR